MIVIEKEAELKLLDELKRIRHEPNGYRFIHYSFSQMKEEERGLVQELLTLKIIADIIENPHAKVFVCEDMDVIIIGQNIFTRTFDELTIEIYNLCQITIIREFSKFYDVDNSWPRLYNLAKNKYQPILDRKRSETEFEAIQRKTLEKQTVLSASHVDKKLIASIAERRLRRSEINILIVEDDAFSRKLIRNVLNKQYHVIDVEDGKDAVETYILISPDIIFLDIDLPDINGHEILESILKIDPSAYIVMLSGNSDQDNVIRAIKEGAKGFVTKPFVKDRLYKYISECPTVQKKIIHQRVE